MRLCGCPEKIRHVEGCPQSHRRKDFFRLAKRKDPLVILTCLDCRGYLSVTHEAEARNASCPRCGGMRMHSTTSKPTATFDGRY